MTAPKTMTLPELLSLIAESQGEWEHIEFKKLTSELHGGMESLCGFLNGSGGKVLFGVTNAGQNSGAGFGRSTFQEVANAIRKLEPPAWIEQTRVVVGGHEGSLDPGDDRAGRRSLHVRRPALPAHRQHDLTDAAGGIPAASSGPRECPAPVGEPGRGTVLRERSGPRGDRSGRPGRDLLRAARKPVVRPA